MVVYRLKKWRLFHDARFLPEANKKTDHPDLLYPIIGPNTFFSQVLKSLLNIYYINQWHKNYEENGFCKKGIPDNNYYEAAGLINMLLCVDRDGSKSSPSVS